MSIVDDKTPIILDWIDKISSDFQKMFKTKFGSWFDEIFSQTYNFSKFS